VLCPAFACVLTFAPLRLCVRFSVLRAAAILSSLPCCTINCRRLKNMTTNRIAIATFERLPNLSPDDQLFLQELAGLGLTVEPAVWSDGSVDWSRFSSIVIRSCWDYHHRHDSFLEWLTKIEGLGLSIWNRPTLIRWNIDKIYLRELKEKGFRIPPTVWVDQGDSIDVREVLRSQGWQRAVIKPRVSASGHRTVLVGGEKRLGEGALPVRHSPRHPIDFFPLGRRRIPARWNSSNRNRSIKYFACRAA
jgi:hypothetical protein